jgi:hypothetical protein
MERGLHAGRHRADHTSPHIHYDQKRIERFRIDTTTVLHTYIVAKVHPMLECTTKYPLLTHNVQKRIMGNYNSRCFDLDSL